MHLAEIVLGASAVSKITKRLDDLGWENIKGGIIALSDRVKGKTDKNYTDRAKQNPHWRAKWIGNYAFSGNVSSSGDRKYFFYALLYNDGEDIYSAQNGSPSHGEGKSVLEEYLRKNLPGFF